jgi:uncharacterized protein YqgC (DUF456 family)
VKFFPPNFKLKTTNLEWLWIILGIILCIVGIIGSLLPLLPGPPIAYVGILLQLFRNPDPFDPKTYWIFAGVVRSSPAFSNIQYGRNELNRYF